jgi:hypothetical protein
MIPKSDSSFERVLIPVLKMMRKQICVQACTYCNSFLSYLIHTESIQRCARLRR